MGCRRHVPVWHQTVAKHIKSGKLVLLGVTQEQHPERCRLFAQWKNFDWPILHDPITILGTTVVPVPVAIDEHGIVRSTRPNPRTFERDFLNKTFKDDAKNEPRNVTPKPDIAKSRKKQDWLLLGDALTLWGGGKNIESAIGAYQKALKDNPKHGPTLFRLGVCYRRRYESSNRQPDDFQKAVEYWGRALASNPNQYIWRRRIQQYGPRLEKPYSFYDWIDQAQKEIRKRGDTPVKLKVLPVGAEIAFPSRRFPTEGKVANNPDPKGKIIRDTDSLIRAEVTVVPDNVRAGKTARVHVTFFPNVNKKAHWNNEAEPLRFWIDTPEGWKVSRQLHESKMPKSALSMERRSVDFEIQVPSDAKGRQVLKGYALYYVCEDVEGSCRYLRGDVDISFEVK